MKVKINGKTFTAQERDSSSVATSWEFPRLWEIYNEETSSYVNTPIGT